jgi:hypothetical protein
MKLNHDVEKSRFSFAGNNEVESGSINSIESRDSESKARWSRRATKHEVKAKVKRRTNFTTKKEDALQL